VVVVVRRQARRSSWLLGAGARGRGEGEGSEAERGCSLRRFSLGAEARDLKLEGKRGGGRLLHRSPAGRWGPVAGPGPRYEEAGQSSRGWQVGPEMVETDAAIRHAGELQSRGRRTSSRQRRH
jgi:hypothetical protein